MGRRCGAVDEQRFGGAAHAGAAHLGVEHDARRHREIGGGVHVDVADALEMGEDRHPRLRLHPRDEALAAARHDHVEGAVEAGQHGADGRAVAGRHQLNGVLRQAGLCEAVPHGVGENGRGPEAVRSGAQDRRVAGLDAQGARVGGHVGAALENDPDHPERGRHALDDEAVRTLEGGEPAADRVGQIGDALDGGGDRLDPAAIQHEPVEERPRLASALRLGDVVGVGGENGRRRRADGSRHGAQGGVLLALGRKGETVGSGPGATAELGHYALDVAAGCGGIGRSEPVGEPREVRGSGCVHASV